MLTASFTPSTSTQATFEPSQSALNATAVSQGTADNFPVFTPSAQFSSFTPSSDSSLISGSIPFQPSQSNQVNAMYTTGAQASPFTLNAASQGFVPSCQAQQADESMYKSELCKNWTETGFCRYAKKCQYAHGINELRAISAHQYTAVPDCSQQVNKNDKYKS